jgi:ribosomal protein L11 methylase PrmA
MLWDVGCNTGDFAATALQAGAGFAVGFDADHRALEKAYVRAKTERLRFIPLYQDLASPSPSQGWSEHERRGMGERRCADALLALAIVHHLAIGRNVPLPDVVRWLVGLAPNGIIEFVPKADPTVQMMLSVRQDIFDGYTEEAFAAALRREAAVVECQPISASGRKLFIYIR